MKSTVFYGGEWRTPESIARRNAHRSAWKKTPAGKAANAEYYARHKEKINAKARAKYHQMTRESILEKQREYRKKLKASRPPSPPREPAKSRAQLAKEYRQRHPEKVKKALKEYRQKHLGKIREWKRAAHHRGMTRPEFVVVKRLRGRLHAEIRFRARKTHKFVSAVELVGCSRAKLVAHLESLFKPGMSWENRSEWHIDHIRPVSSFNMLDLEEQKRCFHFSNLQPLWRHENCSKSYKIIESIGA